MQTSSSLSLSKLLIAAAAFGAGILVTTYTAAPTAQAASAPVVVSFNTSSMHDDVDWSRVAATPADPAKTVAAYER